MRRANPRASGSRAPCPNPCGRCSSRSLPCTPRAQFSTWPCVCPVRWPACRRSPCNSAARRLDRAADRLAPKDASSGSPTEPASFRSRPSRGGRSFGSVGQSRRCRGFDRLSFTTTTSVASGQSHRDAHEEEPCAGWESSVRHGFSIATFFERTEQKLLLSFPP